MASTPEMPCYRSHKKVWALKITRVLAVPGKPNSRFLKPENVTYPLIEVDVDFMVKHQPFQGGYFVVYKDGYQSFSPAQAFEDGYTLCDDCEGSEGETFAEEFARVVCEIPDPSFGDTESENPPEHGRFLEDPDTNETSP